MKLQNKLQIFGAVLGIGLLLTSCQKSGADVVSQETQQDQLTTAAVETETEVDNVTDDVSVIVDRTYNNEEFANKSATLPGEHYLPDCATVTKVITDATKDITIDFGDACVLRNGNTVSGKILIHYVLDKTALTKSVEVSFDNFYNNRRKIEGGFTILKERENQNGNPQSTNTFNITVTWPDDSTAHKEGTKTRELIEGGNTATWGDDVFKITGHWNFTRKDGTVHVTTITTPLRRELSCRFIVSGVIAIQKNDQAAVLDFGDGTCDDLAMLTKDGVTTEIHLRK